MADQQSNSSGFVLPPPSGATPAPATAAAPAPAATTITIDTGGATDTSARDLLIGGGILLVLLIAFFFARGGYANALVRKRVPPGKANAAGWWLFVFLSSLSALVVLAALNPARFLAPLVVGPLAIVSIAGLVLMLVTGRR